MKTIMSVLVTVACLGCGIPHSSIVVTEPDELVPPPDLASARWFSMPEDSSLYRLPAAPDGYSEPEAKQYMLGHKSGWEDEGDDTLLGIIPGQTNVEWLVVPASVAFPSETEAHKRGMADGRKQARRDFEVFRRTIEERARTQNKPPVRANARP